MQNYKEYLCRKNIKAKYMGLFTGNGAYRKARDQWNQYLGEADSYYKGIANEGLNNSQYQAVLAKQREMLRDTISRQAAQAAITGASPAAQALARQQAYNSLADTMTGLGARASEDSKAAMDKYMAASQAARSAIANTYVQQDQAMNAGISGLIGSGIDLAKTFIAK